MYFVKTKRYFTIRKFSCKFVIHIKSIIKKDLFSIISLAMFGQFPNLISRMYLHIIYIYIIIYYLYYDIYEYPNNIMTHT